MLTPQNLAFNLTLTRLNKSSTLPPEYKSRFQEIRIAYLNRRYKLIATDGSKTSDGVGCAFLYENYSELYKLNNYNSIFTAELFAIYRAVSYASSMGGDFVIFTDSLSSMLALQNNHKYSYMVHSIYEKLSHMRSQVVVCWVPSHVGIEINDRVDHLAKEAVTCNNYVNVGMSHREGYEIIGRLIHNTWRGGWSTNGSLLAKLNRNIANLQGYSSYCPGGRRDQVIMARLRLNCCYFHVQHYVSGGGRLVCNRCGVPLSLQHIFVDCPLYTVHRISLRDECARLSLGYELVAVLSHLINPNKIINYLKKCNLVGVI